jgi:transcriptional regulator with XRE-family HTH domain
MMAILPPQKTAPDREHLGRRLRELRRQQGLTLKALSGRSGVALSTLSKIELGQIAVSYEKLAAAAHGLGVDIGELFGSPEPARGDHGTVVVRSTIEDAPGYDAENYDYRALATAFPGKRMVPMHGRIFARSREQFPDYIRHAGQEFVMVLSGQVRLHFETGEVIDLKRSESAYFDSGVGHLYLSTGKGVAEVLVVMAEG